MIAMIAKAALEAGRKLAEERMTATVTVERSTGVQDELTGQFVRQIVYTGKARITTYEAFESKAELPGVSLVVQRYAVHFPVSAGKLEVDDIITVTSAPNPLLVGNQYRVAGPHEKIDQTAQRVLVDHMPSQ